MTKYQFVVDRIPDEHLDTFLSFMEAFRNKTNCQFRYKQGASVKYSLQDVPSDEPNDRLNDSKHNKILSMLDTL